MKEDIILKTKKIFIQNFNDFYETTFPHTCVRPFVTFLQEHFKGKHDLVGVEIGVYLAHNSYNLCQCLPINKLFLIDPYGVYQQGGKTYTTQNLEEKAHKRMKGHKNKVVWLRKLSEECYMDIPNNIDFVYVDGNHDYDFVKKDIEIFFPKLVHGGVIGGDDLNASYLGVVKAVTEFARNYKLNLQGSEHDWWFIK